MKHREISMVKHLELPAKAAVQDNKQSEEDNQLKDRSEGVIHEEELIKCQQRKSHPCGQGNGL